MMIISLAAAVVAITLVVLAAFMIPAFIEIRKTTAATRDFVTRTDAELQPILKELHETLTEVRMLTGGIVENADEVRNFIGAIGETGRGLRLVSAVVGSVASVVSSSSLWLTGIKVAGKFLLETLNKKRR